MSQPPRAQAPRDQPRAQRTLDARAARIASRQHGVVSRAQLYALGASRDALRHRRMTGRWEQVARDVFRIAGTPETWLQALTIAVLDWGPGAVVSHRAAAALWHLPGFDPELIEVTVPRRRRRDSPGIVHRNTLRRADRASLAGLPITTPARTLIDIAGVTPAPVVEEALDDALRRSLTSLIRLRHRIDALAAHGRPGIAAIRALAAARAPASAVPQSVLETRLNRALRAGGLPAPRRQFAIRARGRLVGVVDFAYPDARLAIEADGYAWHTGRARWEHDRARRNALTQLGWRVVHVTWHDLESQPHAVLETITRCLRSRGSDSSWSLR